MTIYVNGALVDLAAVQTLADVLKQQGYTEWNRIVVAVNQTIVPATEYERTALTANDQIDVLGAITGG